MNELTYLPVTDRNGDYYEIGLSVDGNWFPLYASAANDALSGFFVDEIDKLTSIKVTVDSGTATFRKENSKYWYAYKKLKGKLNKAYVGSSDDFTELNIVSTVEKVNTPKAVTQNNNCVTDKPIIELAGKGKSDRHLQPSLITENESLAMAQAEIKALKKQNDILVDRIINVTELYQEQWQKASRLEDHANDAQTELHACQHQSNKFGTALIDCENAIVELEQTIFKLECEASKQEEHFLGYKFCAEQDHDALYKLECKFEAVKYCINQHRELAKGKTRQAHPRFNKLLDFLEDIDKLDL